MAEDEAGAALAAALDNARELAESHEADAIAAALSRQREELNAVSASEVSRLEALLAASEEACAAAHAKAASAEIPVAAALPSISVEVTKLEGLPPDEASALVWSRLRVYAVDHGRLRALDLFREFDKVDAF